MGASQTMKLEPLDSAKLSISSLNSSEIPAQGEIITFENGRGEEVLAFHFSNCRGNKLYGTMFINTKAALNDEVLNTKPNYQRVNKETKITRDIRKCYEEFFATKNPTALPAGQVILGVRPGETIFTAAILDVIDGGHRVRKALDAAKKAKKHMWYPVDVAICVGEDEAGLAHEFRVANTKNTMGADSLINSAVIEGKLSSVWGMFKDAEKRGLAGKYRIVHSPEEHRENKATTLPFYSLLPDLMFGLTGYTSTNDIIEHGNIPSQYAVDSYLKVYVMFCEMIGRKSIENTGPKNERKMLDCKVFTTTLSRLSVTMPIVENVKPVYRRGTRICVGLNETHWRNIMQSFTQNEGSGYLVRDALRCLKSAGGNGRNEMWVEVLKQKLDAHGDNKYRVTPDSNWPRHTNPEMLDGGKDSVLWFEPKEDKTK